MQAKSNSRAIMSVALVVVSLITLFIASCVNDYAEMHNVSWGPTYRNVYWAVFVVVVATLTLGLPLILANLLWQEDKRKVAVVAYVFMATLLLWVFYQLEKTQRARARAMHSITTSPNPGEFSKVLQSRPGQK